MKAAAERRCDSDRRRGHAHRRALLPQVTWECALNFPVVVRPLSWPVGWPSPVMIEDGSNSPTGDVG